MNSSFFSSAAVLHQYPTANASEDYVRPTIYGVPNKQSLLNKWPLPFGCIVHPFTPLAAKEKGRTPVPFINFSPLSPVRCGTCRTYINPYVQFIENGKKWKCNICFQTNTVSSTYYSPLNSAGFREDLDKHPELTNGSVEILASNEYYIGPPRAPSFLFLIDVSPSAIDSGMAAIVCHSIAHSLDSIQHYNGERTLVSLVTFDRAVTFYSLAGDQVKPRVYVCPDTSNLIFPAQDDLVVPLKHAKKVLYDLLTTYILPSAIRDREKERARLDYQSSPSGVSAGSALNAAVNMLNPRGGTILFFLNSRPTAGTGLLADRFDTKVVGTDKEYTLLDTTDQFYKQLSSICVESQTSVSIFAFPSDYLDLATLGSLCQFTCGDLFTYENFLYHDPIQDKARVANDIVYVTNRRKGYEAVFRLRSSRGIKAPLFYGHFFMQSADLLATPNTSEGQAIGMEFEIDDTLLTNPEVYIQCSSLFTTEKGERRIRVHTVRLPVISSLQEMFRLVDTQATVSLLAKIAAQKAPTTKLPDLRAQFLKSAARVIANNHALSTSAGPVVQRTSEPETLRYLLLYMLGLFKTPLLRISPDLSPDLRTASRHHLFLANPRKFLSYVCPRVFALHAIRADNDECTWVKEDEDSERLTFRRPSFVRLTHTAIKEDGIYLVENGLWVSIYIMRHASEDLKRDLFVPSVEVLKSLESEDSDEESLTASGNSGSNSENLRRETDRRIFQAIQGRVSYLIQNNRLRRYQLASKDHSSIAEKVNNLIGYLSIEFADRISQAVYVYDVGEDTYHTLAYALVEDSWPNQQGLDDFSNAVNQMAKGM